MDDVIEEIQNLFNLAAISESIANDWAGSNYLDFNEVDPPEALTDGTCLDCLQLVQQELQKADLKDGPAFWKRLVEAEVAPVGLVGFLWALIEVALKKDSNLEQVKCGAFASSIYMKLCTVNGASIYKFYQQSIVQKVLDIWRLALRVVLYGVRNVQITEKTQRRNKKSKKVECNDEAPDACLPQQDMLRILNKSTNDLYIFLNTIPLADQPEIAIHTARYISDLAELDHFEKEISYKVVDGLDEFANLKLYCERSLALCHILAHGRHSADCSLIYERIVQPRLLLWSWQNTAYGGAASMPTSLIHFGEVMLRFVEQRIAVADEKELKIIDELIYALIVRCPDRAEYRARVPHTIISLIKIMPQNRHYNFRFTLWDLATRNNSMATVVELSILMIKEFDWNIPDPYTEELANANKNKQQSHENNAIKEELESDEEGVDMDRTRKRKDKKRKQKERDALHNSTLADETHTGTRAVEKAKKAFELPYFPKGKALLYRILIGAIVHSSSTIRARALCLVAELLQNKDHVDFVKDAAFDLIFSYNYAEDIVFDEGARPSANPTAIDRLFPILTMCCRDEKVSQRLFYSIQNFRKQVLHC
ncbi:unnamed protein product, partial [Mesorhabditis belari]|uniref:Condensin complex subunit 1 n=1 Tax=Mesorhabditis belari TaxID=2138241 RepID=A0AAF3F2C0_9BILA